MSDLSGLSSIGGTLSALQDTGLREFIETNSGSWTGGVDYSAISGKLAPEDIAVFEFHSDSATFEAISAAYSAGKICFLRTTPTPANALYLPLVEARARFMSSPGLFGFASILDYDDAWSSKNATFSWYTITDAITGHNAWHSTVQPLVIGEKTAFMFNSAIGYDGNGKISGYNGSAFAGGAGGAEYSAGSNIDITDNVISGKDWTSEITAATEDMVTTGDLVGYLTGDFSGNGQPLTFTNKNGKILYNDKMVLTNEGLSAHVNYNYSFNSNLILNVFSGISAWEGDTYNTEWNWGLNSAGVYYFDGLNSVNWTGIKNTDIALDGDSKISAISGHELKSVDLTPYQTTAGMTAYIPATVVATSADATGSNILYVVTGE